MGKGKRKARPVAASKETAAAQLLRHLHREALVAACRPKPGAKWPQRWARRANEYLCRRSHWWRGLTRELRDAEVEYCIREAGRRYVEQAVRKGKLPSAVLSGDPGVFDLAAMVIRNLASRVLGRLERTAREHDRAGSAVEIPVGDRIGALVDAQAAAVYSQAEKEDADDRLDRVRALAERPELVRLRFLLAAFAASGASSVSEAARMAGLPRDKMRREVAKARLLLEQSEP